MKVFFIMKMHFLWR